MRLIVLTGLSGAGKTTALHALEDAGFFAVDNLPPPLLPSFVSMIRQHVDRAAVVMDVRSYRFMDDLLTILDETSRSVDSMDIMFVEGELPHLLTRFKRTRRPHPLGGTLADAIEQERALLQPLRSRARWIIDTSRMSVHDLRRKVQEMVVSGKRPPLHVQVVSFGFNFGIVQEADLVFDVRFLPNPYFEPDLSHLDGTDERIRSYVLESDTGRTFMAETERFLRFLLPQYEEEGKSYLTVAVGCTGGRHRSVSVAISLAGIIKGWGYGCSVVHRDKDRSP